MNLMKYIMVLSAMVAGLVSAADKKITYEEHVKPVFKEHCLNCHNPDKSKGDLNLASYQALLVGSSSGEIVQPGNPSRSVLMSVITHADEPEMPPKKPKIPGEQIATIEAWIKGGLLETSGSVARKSDKRAVDFNAISVVGGVKGVEALPVDLPDMDITPAPHPHPVTAMASSRWAPVAAVAGHERIVLYHTDTLESLGELPFPERIAFVLKFSRNGELLLAAGGRGGHSGKVVVFDVKTGRRMIEVGDEYDTVLAADISADHKYIALGGPSKFVKIYSTEDGKQLFKIKKHTDWVTAMEFSPDGQMLASGDRSGGLHVWDPRVGGIIFTLDEHKERVTDLSWRADGELLASCGEDGKLVLWDTIEGWAARNVSIHKPKAKRARGGVLSVEYNQAGQLVTAGRDKQVLVLDGRGSVLKKFGGFDDLPTQAVFTHDNLRVLSGDYTGAVKVWDVKKAELAGTLQ